MDKRYIACAFEDGWRCYDMKEKRWWGMKVKRYPHRIVRYLNTTKERQRDSLKLSLMMQDYNKENDNNVKK